MIAAVATVWHARTVKAGDPEGIELTYSNANPYNWGRHETLEDYHKRHGSDFGSETEDDYAKKANDFYKNRKNYEVKVDEKKTIRVYDKDTNTFGSYNPDGSTKTFYKPKREIDYWNDQPGDLVDGGE